LIPPLPFPSISTQVNANSWSLISSSVVSWRENQMRGWAFWVSVEVIEFFSFLSVFLPLFRACSLKSFMSVRTSMNCRKHNEVNILVEKFYLEVGETTVESSRMKYWNAPNNIQN
jgi:hypothetical protein